MGKLIKEILDWSEVWALLIPLTVMLWKRSKKEYLKPIRLFVWIILPVNIIIDLISKRKDRWGLTPEDLLWNNNVFYNIESLLRLFLFAWFFILLRQKFMQRIKLLIPLGFLVFVIINFSFYEHFVPMGEKESFSSRLLSTESALLLFYCLQYFIFLLIDDRQIAITRQPGFWIVTGLSIYMAVSFFIFLFHSYLHQATKDFAVNIWDVHNIVFILLCVFITKQFWQDRE